MAHVTEITLPYVSLFGTGTLERTFVLHFTGPRAYAASHAVVAIMIMNKYKIKASDIEDIFRYEAPGVWFAKLSKEFLDATSVSGATLNHEGFTAILTDARKRQLRATLHWLPPEANEEAARLIAASFLKGEFTLQKSKGASDRWIVFIEEGENIPHYVYVNTRAPDGSLRRHVAMVTVPGRRQACRHCSADDHWTTACPIKKQQRINSFNTRRYKTTDETTAETTDHQQPHSGETTQNNNTEGTTDHQQPHSGETTQKNNIEKTTDHQQPLSGETTHNNTEGTTDHQQQEEDKQQPKQQRQQQQQRHSGDTTQDNNTFTEVVRKRRQPEKSPPSSSPTPTATQTIEPKKKKMQTKTQRHQTTDTENTENTSEDEDPFYKTPPKLIIDDNPKNIHRTRRRSSSPMSGNENDDPDIPQ